MNLIYLSKPLPDGRTMHFHRIEKVEFADEPGHLIAHVGSFENEALARVQSRPDATFTIPIAFTGEPYDFVPGLLDYVAALPEWSEGIVAASLEEAIAVANSNKS